MVSSNKDTMKRCEWSEHSDLERVYHDEEWGVPLHDDRKLFEYMILDAAQAGLSWLTILKKRENYQKAFDNFQPEKIARYTPRRVALLLRNPGIIRNRLKIESSISNARIFLKLKEEFGSFDRYIWQFVGERPIQNAWHLQRDVPPTSPESEAMSRDLKKRGFRFVGSTICYAFMQAAGMVNDHVTSCFRYRKIAALGKVRSPKKKSS